MPKVELANMFMIHDKVTGKVLVQDRVKSWNIKMIILDLDGTLLCSDKSISEYTSSVLEKCKKKGVKIAIATARSEKAAKKYIDIVKPDIVISNGGSLVRCGDNNILYKCMLSSKVSDNLINECIHKREVVSITSETETGYYVNWDDPPFSSDYAHAIIHDFSVPLSEDTYKITIEILNDKVAQEIADIFPQCRMLAFTGENYYRFASKNSSKINAIRETAKSLNIDMSQVVAFGDDYNDFEMIIECGIGVAMGNAIDEVKTVADYVCDTNDNDGVAKLLEERIILGVKTILEFNK